jgi:hypothetical protein
MIAWDWVEGMKRVAAAAFLCAISTLAFCQALSFSHPTQGKLRIDFIAAPDWVRPTRFDGPPETLSVDLVDSVGAEVHIDSFMQEGPASPTLASVFKVGQTARARLFLIMKWHYYVPGINRMVISMRSMRTLLIPRELPRTSSYQRCLALDPMGGRMG